MANHNLPRQLRRADEIPPELPGQPDSADSPVEDRDGAIKCRYCQHPVTDERWRIEMAGCHGHRVTNPHGNEFVIGCFGMAAGCLAAGRPYRLHSWFSGYQWQIALCRHCGAHLGWFFSQQGKASFFALIFSRING
ncbi:MAG: cereblon family protein [Gammaproteobacteria bacterium]